MATAASALAAPRTGTSQAWLIGLLSAAIMLSYVDRNMLAVAGPLIKSELGLSATAFGLAVSAFFWSYTPAQLLCGWMMDRYSPQILFALGLATWAVATGLMGLASGLVALFAVRLLLGLGQGFCFPGSSKMISNYCDPSKRGACNGSISAGLAIGQAIGAGLGGLIMAYMGWRWAAVFFAALTLTWLWPWSRVRLVVVSAEAQETPSTQIPFATILRKRALIGTCLCHFCNNYTLYFTATWIPLYLVDQRGMSIAAMALLAGAVYALQALSAVGSGWLSDRMIAGGRHEGAVRKAFQVAGNLAKAAGIVAIALSDNITVLTVCLLLTGVAMGLPGAQNFAVPQVFAGHHAVGRWVGVQNCVANIAGIVGPVATGLIIDATGGYNAAFFVSGAVTALGVLAWIFVVPRIEPIDWAGPKKARGLSGAVGDL